MVMAKGKRRVKDGVIIAGVFISIIIFALILGWWQKHAAIGWTIIGIIVVVFAFSLYRFPRFRSWVFKKGENASKKVVFTDEAPGREPIPQNLYNRIIQHANYRCQNPDCKYQGKPEIHHINQNNRDNRFWNLIALCPNCHKDAHSGRFSFSQLRNWNKMKSVPKPTQR
jgi:hypothetical protein